MIKSFQHAGLESFFLTGSKAGIIPAHKNKLDLQLLTLDAATGPKAMNIPGWKLHELQRAKKGIWSVKVNGNWRVTFRFEGEDAVLVNYDDYH